MTPFDAFLNSTGVTTDTRSIPQGSIFFALKGARFNGNEFALKALELGASYAVVDEAVGKARADRDAAPSLCRSYAGWAAGWQNKPTK